MYQVKIFSGSNIEELQGEVNDWLTKQGKSLEIYTIKQSTELGYSTATPINNEDGLEEVQVDWGSPCVVISVFYKTWSKYANTSL